MGDGWLARYSPIRGFTLLPPFCLSPLAAATNTDLVPPGRAKTRASGSQRSPPLTPVCEHCSPSAGRRNLLETPRNPRRWTNIGSGGHQTGLWWDMSTPPHLPHTTPTPKREADKPLIGCGGLLLFTFDRLDTTRLPRRL